MRLLLDMNLSPQLGAALTLAGWEAVHWSDVGDARARDTEILAHAFQHNYVLVTYDLDFGDILAATGAHGPSVVLLRHVQDLLGSRIGMLLIAALSACEEPLERGAIVTVDATRARVRVLPIDR